MHRTVFAMLAVFAWWYLLDSRLDWHRPRCFVVCLLFFNFWFCWSFDFSFLAVLHVCFLVGFRCRVLFVLCLVFRVVCMSGLCFACCFLKFSVVVLIFVLRVVVLFCVLCVFLRFLNFACFACVLIF